MSDTSSITSCNSSESDFFEEDKERLFDNFKCKKTDHFLKKLFSREVGLCQLKPRFSAPPDRLKFPLHKTLPTATLHSHIFLGISSCGRLLITYTYTTDIDDRPISFNTIFKYRLHWWAFVPYAEARKVAEVTLFGNCYVYTPLYLAYCQWPRDSSKIVVFGRSGPSDNGLMTQNERSYVTVTAVPSLQNCEECQKVAASFEEEDIAASWDSCARLNCLVHGLTVHTSFEMAPPYPKFFANISMKNPGRVVLNSGNFLHVIRVGLENVFESKAKDNSHGSSHLQSDQFSFRSQSLASSNLNVRLSEYQNQALIGLDQSASTATSSDLACDSHSIVEELNIISQGCVGLSSTKDLCCQTDSLTLETDSDASSQRSSILSPPLRRRVHSNIPVRGQQGRINKVDAGKAYDFCEQKDERIYESLSSFRKRRLADKKYEFIEEDTEDSENIVPFRLSRQAECAILSPSYPLPPSPLTFSAKDRNSSRTSNSLGDRTGATSPLRWKSFAKTGGPHGETSDVNSPGLIFIDPNVEPDKVVLRPQNRNHPLLSPREQDLPRELNKRPISTHFETNILGSPPAPSLSLQTQNLRLSSEKSDKISMESSTVIQIANETHTNDPVKNAFATKSSLPSKWTDVAKNTDVMKGVASNETVESEGCWSKGRCTVQFERRFIEVDDELVSVITDIEDDDESGSTGYHSALPLEVHGTGYVQMQMISNSKAEKLMAPCALVHQMSFDIEQFCHEVAEVLCGKAGMKFWYCNNYDVEIVDVCPQSADVICLAYMKIKATLKSKGVPKSIRLTNDRQQYQTSCLFVWNMNTSMYRVEKSGPLVRLETATQDEEELPDIKDMQYVPGSPENSGDDWNPAREEAQELRMKCVSNCWGANQPPVKVMSNDPVLKEKSLEEIIHVETGISFVL